MVMLFADGRPVRVFHIPHKVLPSRHLRWTPDGQALCYAADGDGVSNLWAQPLDGGPPRQLTHFTADRIFNFEWSPDGKQLACTRGAWAHDVVLISDFR
ncbi:MAG TPA: hypothetical protein VNO70_05220 [Blastocatellia bacterium]|nr:hypothetical protein [Blastocatellia bacterium]